MAIRYTGDIKKPLETHDYNIEQIQELDKCSDDIWSFLKYVKVVHPDRGRIHFVPYEYQKKMLRMLQKNRFVVGLWSRQSGKCLCGNTILKIRNKQTGLIEEFTIQQFYDKIKKEE